jgi:cupin superfamily acireductone dioxygenase involved in methionine salvage
MGFSSPAEYPSRTMELECPHCDYVEIYDDVEPCCDVECVSCCRTFEAPDWVGEARADRMIRDFEER